MNKVKKTKNKNNFIKKLFYLFRSVKEYKLETILTIVFVSIEVLLECIIPLIMSLLIEELEHFNDNSLKTIIYYSIVLISLALLSLLFGILSAHYCAKASTGFIANLRRDFYYKVQEFSFKNIDKFSIPSLVSRQTVDMYNISYSYMMIIRTGIRAPLMFIFSIIMALVINYELAWIFLITIPLLAISFIFLVWYCIPLYNRLFKKYDDLNESIEENVRGIRTVKMYVREEYEKKKFHSRSEELRVGFTKAERIISLENPIMRFSMNLGMVLFLTLGSLMIIKNTNYDSVNDELIFNKLSFGDLSSLITYSAQTLNSLMMFYMLVVILAISIASINRVYEVLVEVPTIKEIDNPIKEVENGDIIFNNVSFKYNEAKDKKALYDITLHIKSGQSVGIIGATGSSKSTLVNLISRFYDVSEGEVLLANQNVKNYDLKVLRDNVSMVLQKNVLFSGTIKENLKWGNENASDEEIKKACKIAQADSFIETLKDKYDSKVEQGGTNFSGGQKQRLCIARALLKKPKVLILDDSTSAVDTKTDAFIRKGLKETLKDTTKIIIAQRISSVMDSDFIIVMDNGTINGIGSHEELMQNNKIYQEVYHIQNRMED